MALLGHAPDLLVEILRALGQGIDVELGPQGLGWIKASRTSARITPPASTQGCRDRLPQLGKSKIQPSILGKSKIQASKLTPRKGVEKVARPGRVAELVDHGAVVDVDLVDLLQKPEVLPGKPPHMRRPSATR